MILVSVTLAVAAIPEGIPLCVTISLPLIDSTSNHLISIGLRLVKDGLKPFQAMKSL